MGVALFSYSRQVNIILYPFTREAKLDAGAVQGNW